MKIKVFVEKTFREGNDTIHKINFGIKQEDIPNYSLLKNIPEIKRYVKKNAEEYKEYFKFHIKGTAHLSKQDIYDEKKGEYIAKTKAQLRMHHKLTNFFSGLVKIITKALSIPLFDLEIHHSNKRAKCNYHLYYELYNKKDRKYTLNSYYKN